MRVEALPPRPDEVQLRSVFAASSMWHALREGGCALRALASATATLTSDVSSFRGRVAHEVVDSAARCAVKTASGWEPLPWAGDRHTQALRVFERVVNGLSPAALTAQDREEWLPLERTLGPVLFDRYRSDVVSRAQLLASDRPRCAPPSRKHDLVLQPGRVYTEVTTPELEGLPVVGRMDEVVLDDSGTLTITDYKTGAATRGGAVKPEYAAQLIAYALLARKLEARPRIRRVRAYVRGAEGLREVEIGPQQEDELRTEVLSVAQRLPLGESVRPVEFASPGPSCVGCPMRHTCGPYLDWAPKEWQNRHDGVLTLPFDAWGEVQSVKSDLHGLRVSLVDPEGVQRLIKSVNPAREGVVELVRGQRIYFFQLGTDNFQRFGEVVHPRNFFEVQRDPSDTAWSVDVFREGQGGHRARPLLASTHRKLGA